MSEHLLIVASSGRMLALAASKSDFIPLVVDLYADQDTRALSGDVFRVDVMNEQNLKTAISHFTRRYPVTRAIYGSGLERTPECVEVLARYFNILGNDYDTFRKVQLKCHFFALLAELRIPSPESVFDKPRNPSGWLVKPLQGQGGVGIRRYTTGHSVAETAVYWQKMIAGVSGSVLFLADGLRVRVVGYNTQWSSSTDLDSEFVFAGIINKSPLSSEQEQRVNSWIQTLVRQYGLKGLNTLDFIVKGREVFVLEINPRPSASLQLYDGDIFLQHLAACSGRLQKPSARLEGYCGYQIVFADTELQIPEYFQWPAACADLPAPGLIIRKGQPICSIIARDNCPQQVYEKLMTTQQIIANQLKEGH